MTRPDFTRWNRAGLDRFQYVGANAVTLLDDLRGELESAFGGTTWAQSDESTPESRYADTPVEWGWQLSRALARASHILLGYLDAYANEGYLQTATQWENVRRLVSMLGYRPAPPSSASTALTLTLKPGTAGTVPRGLAVRYTSADGSPPVVFETLADVAADEALNSIWLVGHGSNPQVLTGSSITVDSAPATLRSGEPAVLEDPGSGRLEAHMIAAVNGDEVTFAEPISARFVAGKTVVHVVPAERLALLGPPQTGTAQLKNALQLAPGAPPLTTGDVVIVSDTVHTAYRKVTGFRGARVVLNADVGTMDLSTTRLWRPVSVPITAYTPARTTRDGAALFLWKVAGDWSRLVNTRVAVSTATITEYVVTAADYTPVTTPAGTAQPTATALPRVKTMIEPGCTVLTIQRADGGSVPPGNPQRILVPPEAPGPWRLDGLLARRARTPQSGRGTLPPQLITTRPKHAGPGDIMVLARAGQLAWARLQGADELDGGRTASLRPAGSLQERGGGAFYLSDSTVYAGFRVTLNPKDWAVNSEPRGGTTLQIGAQAQRITQGRTLLLIRGDDPTKTVVTSVVGVNIDSVRVADPLPADTTVDNLEIAGNVAVAGHGSTRPTLTLGSGDATQSRQSFAINVTDVSWIDDATMPNGVRADLQITVGGETWTQVGSLDQAGATDDAYEVQVREDGSLLVVFGDGTHGRRLTSGTNNVAARYRSGVGLAGNLAAGSITKLVAPDALVASVRQPLPAGGGSDREGVHSMRTRAPATVLALGRAVALADFGYLAASQSGVWQAQALPATEAGTGESVSVVVVAAGGQAMSPTLRASIEDFLTTRAVPGVRVRAVEYTRARLSISAILDIDTVHYRTDAVIAAVTAALMEQFTLPVRQLGQPVHRSDVFRVVENVAGVADCECYIARDLTTPDPIARVQRLPAAPVEVLALDGGGTSLSVTTGPVR